MKLKSYLRGLGLGMVVTTIILVVTFKAAHHEMTDDEIISKARKLGMVETSLYAGGTATEEFTEEFTSAQPSTNEPTTGEQSGEGKTEPETTEREEETTGKPQETTKKEEETTKKPQETTKSQETTKPQETTKREEETTKKPQEPTTSGKEIVLVFENISSADKASRILYDAGVIQDIDSFNDFLSDNGYARKITEGTFTFTKGMTFEEIAKIITRSR